MTNTGKPLTREELVQRLTIKMAAANRKPPILRGKKAPINTFERDAIRRDFAQWFVEECIEKNGLVVLNTYIPAEGNHMARIMTPRATPPQRWAR